MADFVTSKTGVRVYKGPSAHPLLQRTDLQHPAFARKKRDPRICSENSEDACTWFQFSPLLKDKKRRGSVLAKLLKHAFPSIPRALINRTSSAELHFWPALDPPPSRPQPEHPSYPDLLIKLGETALLLVEAKYKSAVDEKTKHDLHRDQIIRLIDVGSWQARQVGLTSCYVIALQYGNAPTNVEDMVNRYAGNPSAIRKALPYRTDLNKSDFKELSRSVAFVRWPDPLPS